MFSVIIISHLRRLIKSFFFPHENSPALMFEYGADDLNIVFSLTFDCAYPALLTYDVLYVALNDQTVCAGVF